MIFRTDNLERYDVLQKANFSHLTFFSFFSAYDIFFFLEKFSTKLLGLTDKYEVQSSV